MTKEEMFKQFRPLYEKYGEALANFDFAWGIRGHFMQEVGSAKEMRKEIIALGVDAMVAKERILQEQDALLEAHGIRMREKDGEMFAQAADRLRSALLLAEQWSAASMFQYGICAAQFREAVNRMLEMAEDICENQKKELAALCDD